MVLVGYKKVRSSGKYEAFILECRHGSDQIKGLNIVAIIKSECKEIECEWCNDLRNRMMSRSIVGE